MIFWSVCIKAKGHNRRAQILQTHTDHAALDIAHRFHRYTQITCIPRPAPCTLHHSITPHSSLLTPTTRLHLPTPDLASCTLHHSITQLLNPSLLTRTPTFCTRASLRGAHRATKQPPERQRCSENPHFPLLSFMLPSFLFPLSSLLFILSSPLLHSITQLFNHSRLLISDFRHLTSHLAPSTSPPAPGTTQSRNHSSTPHSGTILAFYPLTLIKYL